MYQGKYVFSQVMEFVPHYQFNQCVAKYKGHHYVKSFTCREQFLAMAFGQLAYRESLRDVVVCLRAQRAKLHHLGFQSLVAKTTLAIANEQRDWRIYRDLAQILIQTARRLYVDDAEFDLDLAGAAYVIDSSSIEVCLNIFKWAKFVSTKGAVKLHLMMDLQGNIPAFFHISTGKTHDVNFLDIVDFEPGAYYIMDRGYLDFRRLYRINQAGAYFVTRAKDNTAWKRIYSNPVDKKTGVRCDQIIRFTGRKAREDYPDKLRRIKYCDKETENYYAFLTNDFNAEAKVITDLYKYRWQIELFFKWIKQHLKIKTFWGTSANAVKTQICIAICTYLIVAIIKKKLNLDRNIYEILQILNVSLFDKTPINTLLSEFDLQTFEEQTQNTLFQLGF
jgi:hypothetical protein